MLLWSITVNHIDRVAFIPGVAFNFLYRTWQFKHALHFNNFIYECALIVEVVNVAILELVEVSKTLIVKDETQEMGSAKLYGCFRLQSTQKRC